MKEIPRIEALEVVLTKINPPVKGGIDDVSVVIRRGKGAASAG
jgi:hypothetical protein